jgi:ferredoxin-NADP reductase
MLRHRTARASDIPVRLLYSVQTLPEVIYREEFARLAAYEEIDIRFALTGDSPDGWRGFHRRIDEEMLREVAWPVADRPLVYVCGAGSFLEAAIDGLHKLGYEPDRIRTDQSAKAGW